MTRRMHRHVAQLIVWAWLSLALAASAAAQNDAVERRFPQTKADVENALKSLQPDLSGRLPVLDGFALPGDHPFASYERGYYQTTVKIVADPSGGSLVRVSTKVTAWYSDPQSSQSGYQLLKSNGRLESDLLDQLADNLAANSPGAAKRTEADAKSLPVQASSVRPVVAAQPPVEAAIAPKPAESSRPAAEMPAGLKTSEPHQPVTAAAEAKAAETPNPPDKAAGQSIASEISPPAERVKAAPSQPTAAGTNSQAGPQVEPPISAPPPKFPEPGTFSSSVSQGSAVQERSSASQNAAQNTSVLEDEAKQLEEIIRNQSRPRNLVAIKKSGTPVVSKPSLNAKTLFFASMHDEFEMLDFNQDWVHVRISGLSRGWIWRDSVEMPDGIPDTAVQKAPPAATAADLFRVAQEESASFPGNWQPLRGKNVKIISVQKVDENGKGGGPQDKLEFAKYLLEKNLPDLLRKPDLAGIVVVFDSADGGMLAATSVTLQQWKAGTLSDAALWHNCFFDPAETFMASAPSGTH